MLATEFQRSAVGHGRSLAPFGVEIDIDASRPLAEDAREELRALFRKHYLIILRGQKLDWDKQADFVENLGPIVRDGTESTKISTEGGAGSLGRIALNFHSDLCFTDPPIRGISLYAVDVVDGATSTRFINAVDTYRRLPAAVRVRVEGRRARHVLGVNSEGRNHQALADHLAAEHPVVLRHPDSGDEILYVNEQLTDRIVGLGEEASEALLQELFASLYAPDQVYEHFWHRGDLVIWDNLALQHARTHLENAGRRVLQRVTLAKRGTFDMFPELQAF